jgi:hypothetical protein
MGRGIEQNAECYYPIIKQGLKLSSMLWAPADNEVLDVDSPPLLLMNPAGAVDILLPTSNAANAGLTFVVFNVSASTITFKTDGDAAFTTAIALATLEGTILFCTGHATQALGWRALATALSS